MIPSVPSAKQTKHQARSVGASEYGSTKLGVSPGGGVSAGVELGSIDAMLSIIGKQLLVTARNTKELED